jgi:ribosomal protein S7
MKFSWISVPFHYNEEYSRAITVMDPAANNIDPIKHVKRIQKIGIFFEKAMELFDEQWNDDVYDWTRLFPSYVQKKIDK